MKTSIDIEREVAQKGKEYQKVDANYQMNAGTRNNNNTPVTSATAATGLFCWFHYTRYTQQRILHVHNNHFFL